MPLCLSFARGVILQPIAPPPNMYNNGFQFYPGRRLPVVCRDGITRQAIATGYAGYGLPAAVQVTSGGKRRTVSGTVYPLPFSRLPTFYATGRNSDLIGWTAHKPRLAKLARKLIMATAYGKGAPGYIWDSGADHAAALAAACRAWHVAAYSAPQMGWLATKEFKRIKPALLPGLARFFDKQGKLIAAGE